MKYAVCGLWVASVCTFPLVAAFDQPKVSFSMILYSVICLCFHLYGLFEFLEYKQKGEHGFAFWIVFRFLLTAAMLGMMMYDCVAFIERGGDRDFEPPVPPWILQLIEYSVYLSLPLTDIFKPATDSMEVRTTVTAGTIAKNVGPPPTRGALAPASPRVQSQALLFQAVTSQPTLQHISSSRTLAPRLSMTRQVSWMPSCVTRYESVRTPGAVYDAIVFEGGGVKGAAYAGALRRLEEKGLLGKIKKIGGTSIGAHLAVLLAVGYDSEELAEGLRSMPWEQVFDMDRGFGWRTRAVWNVVTRLGACRGEFILKYVEAQIRKKVRDRKSVV